MRQRLERGLVQVYTGAGKGKTTAALGAALRAVGHGFRACVVQLVKGGGYSGELFAAQRLHPEMKVAQFGRDCPYGAILREGLGGCLEGCSACFIKGRADVRESDRVVAAAGFRYARDAVMGGQYDLVVIDEVSSAIALGLVDVEEVAELMRNRPGHVEVILTGRGMPARLVELADLVTEMAEVKHPFRRGVAGRRGVEY